MLLKKYAPAITGARRGSIPPETKLLGYLSFLRSGTFQWTIGNICGLAQGSVHNFIKEITDATLNFSHECILHPIENKRIENMQNFYNIAKFPNIIGCIDGTHVAIKRPVKDEVVFVNRKQFHSVNCQVITDPKLRIWDVVAKWPGSTHDSFIQKNSLIRDRIYGGFLEKGWLLSMIPKTAIAY